MNWLRVSIFNLKQKRMYSMQSSCNCNTSEYVFSPFMASLIVGSIFSIIIKNHMSNEMLYVTQQNEEIIARLKKIEHKK